MPWPLWWFFSWKEDPAKIDQKLRLSRIKRIHQNQNLRRCIIAMFWELFPNMYLTIYTFHLYMHIFLHMFSRIFLHQSWQWCLVLKSKAYHWIMHSQIYGQWCGWKHLGFSIGCRLIWHPPCFRKMQVDQIWSAIHSSYSFGLGDAKRNGRFWQWHAGLQHLKKISK